MWGKFSYLNLNFLTYLFGWRRSTTNRNFLPSATVNGLQHVGRDFTDFTSTTHCLFNKSAMAVSTNSE